MLKQVYLIIIFCILYVAGYGQSGYEQVHDFGNDTTVSSSIFSVLADTGHFFVSGVTHTQNVSPEHAFIASFTNAGQLLWSKNLFSPGKYNSSLTYRGLHKIGTNKYLFLGEIFDYKINPNHQVWHPYLYVFNGNGDSIFYKAYIDTADTKLFTSAIFDNNAIITVGASLSSVSKTLSLWLCKFDTSGNIIWQKEYLKAPGTSEEIKLIKSADNNGYVMAGWMVDTTIGVEGSCIVKTDTSGNIIWMKRLKKSYLSINNIDIVVSPDGGYYFVSSCSKSPVLAPDSSYVYYGKLNDLGDTLWTKTFSADFKNCYGTHIMWVNNSELLIQVGAYSDHRGGSMKIDTAGNVIWNRIYDHIVSKTPLQQVWGQFHSSAILSDGRYLYGGYTQVMDSGLSWLVVTDSNGCRSSDDPACDPLIILNAQNSKTIFTIYPNPATTAFTTETTEGGILNIYNLQGQQIMSRQIEPGKTFISLPGNAAGVYIARFSSGNKTAVLRLVYEP